MGFAAEYSIVDGAIEKYGRVRIELEPVEDSDGTMILVCTPAKGNLLTWIESDHSTNYIVDSLEEKVKTGDIVRIICGGTKKKLLEEK